MRVKEEKVETKTGAKFCRSALIAPSNVHILASNKKLKAILDGRFSRSRSSIKRLMLSSIEM